MNIRAIKTAESEASVNRIKKLVNHNFDYGVSFKIPDEFIEKRNYMQSDEFIKDKYNSKMFELIDNMMEYRDEIKKNIYVMNSVLKGKIVQAINGFSRLKDDIDKDFSKNFDNQPYLRIDIEKKYEIARSIITRAKSCKTT